MELRRSWGLSLFVLFERGYNFPSVLVGSWGLSLFVLFEQMVNGVYKYTVLED